ncbi:MAG TPA: DUF4350 domain-containing protein [Nannocystaceae bacterium]|nr:DUF4350 domain-containing protein [Nannocystaceae bacterium]
MSTRRSSARTLVAILGLVSLVATVVAWLYGQRLTDPESIDTDTYASGALGHRALSELYQELGVHVLVDREGVHDSAGAPVFFVEPALSLFRRGQVLELQEVLRARAYAGRDSVVVLPKWRLQREGDEDVAIRALEDEVQWMADMALDWQAVEVRREDVDIPETAMLREWTVPGSRGPRRVVLQERQTLRVRDPDIEVLLGTSSSALIVAVQPRGTEGTVIIVSDADLLHNYNLHRGDHARIAVDLLDRLGTDTVVIDEVMHGHGYELTLGAVLGRFPTVLLVVHALLFALLYAWAGLRPFGSAPVVRPNRNGTRAIVELAARAHISGARRSKALVTSYVCVALADTADRLGVRPAKVLGARAEAIDELAMRRGIEGGAPRILAEVSAPGGLKRPLLHIVGDVHRLRRRLLHRGGTR